MNAGPPKTVLRTRRGSSSPAPPAAAAAAVPQRRAGPVVCVEGNIGAGKTRLIRELETLGADPIYEPVDKWQEVIPGDKSANLLGRMYADPSRWAYLFQSYVLLTMMENHNAPETEDVRVMERSVLSARWCFIENLRRSELIDAVEYEVYRRWFDLLMAAQRPRIDLIVYLRTDPEVCMRRIQKRGRTEEESTPLSYVETLHARHEEWLMGDGGTVDHLDGVPVLVLDANLEDNGDGSVYAEHCRKVEAKLAELARVEAVKGTSVGPADGTAAGAGAGAEAFALPPAAFAPPATPPPDASTVTVTPRKPAASRVLLTPGPGSDALGDADRKTVAAPRPVPFTALQ
mmetsp:Transcript_23226/g.60783  ORF Transcript_23226/g.60783 Transcript_23226/m.60783 type:complete len:345 (+) Transcript_23226:79-1113(+)